MPDLTAVPSPDARSPRSELQRRDHAAVWHPCSQMHDYEAFPPLEVRRAAGCAIELTDGHVVLDAISSWWCKSLGHAHPRLTAALREQSENFEHVITANTTSELLVSLCERLLAAANTGRFARTQTPTQQSPAASTRPSDPPTAIPEPWFTKCFFADNGSTGVEVALKMVLQAQVQSGRPKRTKLAALANGYHGETAGAMSVSDLDLYVSPYGSLMTGVRKLGPVPFRSGPDDPRWMDASAEWPAIERSLEQAEDTLAAIIYEPVLQAAGGMRPYSPDLLRRLRAWADAHEVYLIADEIAAGLGRCGAVLASHLVESVEPALPDLAVVSKGLTAGYVPMSVVLTTQAMYERFYGPYLGGQAFMHSNTYAGNALALAVAHAALDEYVEIDVLERVRSVGPGLRARLAALADERQDLQHLRGVGMCAAIDLTDAHGQPLPKEKRTGYAVYRAAVRSSAGVLRDGRRCGALLRPLGDTLYLFPPLNVEDDELDAMVAVMRAAVRLMDE